MNKLIKVRKGERMKEWIDETKDKWMTKWKDKIKEWKDEWMNKRMKGWMNE